MKYNVIWFILWIVVVIVSAGTGTYDVDDAWRQMSGLTDHSATYSAIVDVESGLSSRSTNDRLQTAASSYGGGGYGGGYGGGHGGHGGHGGYGSYLNNSAVALLGFVYLLNLIQDIINQVTTTAATGRKKRAIEDPFREWMTNLGQGGIQSMTYEIVATILPLVSEFTEHGDKNRPVACAQRSICLANRRLTSNYGQMGKVFAKLASGAVLEHFHSTFPDAQLNRAAIDGRNLQDCYTTYNECDQKI